MFNDRKSIEKVLKSAKNVEYECLNGVFIVRQPRHPLRLHIYATKSTISVNTDKGKYWRGIRSTRLLKQIVDQYASNIKNF